MISPDEERYILANAYVPEHTVGLMTRISNGEAFLVHECLCIARDDWVIVVGYPLRGKFTGEGLCRLVGDAVKRFRPGRVWMIAPEMPEPLGRGCRERESDWYYTLGLDGFEVGRDLERIVRRAARELTVERERELSGAHRALVSEFLERGNPGPRVRELFLSMADYVPRSASAVVLTARDKERNVSAFYVVELAAKDFATYVVGCHSRSRYVPGASDLLFRDMMTLAGEHGKRYIHLGLGVNAGIRAFKAKWGGVPYLPYEFCAHVPGPSPIPPLLASKL